MLWVDGEAHKVLRSEKAANKKKESLDELLAKEKEKRDGMATKFEATAALEQEKLKKAREKFEKALGGPPPPEAEDRYDPAWVSSSRRRGAMVNPVKP